MEDGRDLGTASRFQLSRLLRTVSVFSTDFRGSTHWDRDGESTQLFPVRSLTRSDNRLRLETESLRSWLRPLPLLLRSIKFLFDSGCKCRVQCQQQDLH